MSIRRYCGACWYEFGQHGELEIVRCSSDTCADMRADMCADMCADAFVGMCADMCADTCVGMCMHV